MIEDGEIVERGKHADLIERRGRYHQLYTGSGSNLARGSLRCSAGKMPLAGGARLPRANGREIDHDGAPGFDGVTGLQVEEGLIPSTSPLVAAAGGKALKEETSLNFSAGFTASLGERTNLTFDAYRIDVDDRIYRTGDIPNPIVEGRTISFYTNALNVKHQGVDLVLASDFDWSPSVNTNLTLAFGYNEIEVVSQTPVQTPNDGPVLPVSEGTIEDIENKYPDARFVLTTNTFFGEGWNFVFRANFYGKHFDERGTIGAAVDPSFEIGSTFYVDLELGYQVTPKVRLAFGGSNVFDSFVDEIDAPFANRQSVGLQYPRRSAANYEGGSWYVKAVLGF